MKKKILVVDDKENSRITLADILTEYGYEVLKASGGKEALKMVHDEKPVLVLTNVQMPDMDGNEVCREIKKMAGRKIKVVIFTATVDAVDAGKARAAGADDYFVKTEDLTPLVEAVKKLAK